MQLLHLGRVLPGQVGLAEIGGDVEQLEGAIFIPLDELPIAVANRAKGSRPACWAKNSLAVLEVTF